MTRENEELTSISQQAAHWWVVLHNVDAPVAEKREFMEWVARGPDRVEACLRVARVHAAVSRADVRWHRTSAEDLVRDALAALRVPRMFRLLTTALAATSSRRMILKRRRNDRGANAEPGG